MIYERVLMLESPSRCKGYCSYKYLEGRQGASAKRANGDFPCRAWKIVIGPFNHRCFPPFSTCTAFCSNLRQSGAICLCRLSDTIRGTGSDGKLNLLLLNILI